MQVHENCTRPILRRLDEVKANSRIGLRMIAAGMMGMDGEGRYEDVYKFDTVSGSKCLSFHSRTWAQTLVFHWVINPPISDLFY